MTTTTTAKVPTTLSDSMPSPAAISSSKRISTKRRLSTAAANFFRHPLLLLTSTAAAATGTVSSSASSSDSSKSTDSSTSQRANKNQLSQIPPSTPTSLHHNSKTIEDARHAAYQSRWYRAEKMPVELDLHSQTLATCKTIHRFALHKEIGSGRYGKVYLATDTTQPLVDDTAPLALKVMEKKEAFLDELDHLLNFRRYQESSEQPCPFVVQLVTYCELRYVNSARETSRYLLATRLAEGGSLRNVMRSQLKGMLRLTEAEAAFYLLELTEALGYLHSLGVVHQDVKPDNVLLRADGHIILADFGLATLTSVPYAEYRGNIVCKSNHMPPEVHRNESVGVAEIMNHAVDWFSLGVLLFRLVAACYPPTPRHTAEEWKVALKKFHCSRPLASLLQSLTEKDYKQRLGATSEDAEEIFSHAFVRRVVPSVLLCREDSGFALESTSHLRELIREKRLRPVFQPYAIQFHSS